MEKVTRFRAEDYVKDDWLGFGIVLAIDDGEYLIRWLYPGPLSRVSTGWSRFPVSAVDKPRHYLYSRLRLVARCGTE